MPYVTVRTMRKWRARLDRAAAFTAGDKVVPKPNTDRPSSSKPKGEPVLGASRLDENPDAEVGKSRMENLPSNGT